MRRFLKRIGRPAEREHLTRFRSFTVRANTGLDFMARISRTVRNGKVSYRVAFWNRQGRRQSIRLGQIQKRQAEQISTKIQALAESVQLGTSPDPLVIEWVRGVSDDLKAKLAKAGLIEGGRAVTLGELLEAFRANKSAKPATMTKFRHTANNLLAFFPEKTSIQSITSGQAKDFRNWLLKQGNVREGKTEEGRKDLSENTVRRRIGISKQFFGYAVDHGWLTSNPFRGQTSQIRENSKRQYMVSVEEITLAIEHAPSAQWRALLALARYGGMRCPSEVNRLRWEDVDLVGRRMTIYASKTEHHEGGGIRVCPIFPELLPYLEDLSELAKASGAVPTDPIITEQGSEAKYRTRFKAILKKAGLIAWPKLFQNMRASRQTELLSRYPVKDVCRWLGNSPAVAMKHYAMALEQTFQDAAGLHAYTAEPTKCPEGWRTRVAQSKHITGYQEPPNDVERPAAEDDLEQETTANPVISRVSSEVTLEVGVGEEGLEPPTSTV